MGGFRGTWLYAHRNLWPRGISCVKDVWLHVKAAWTEQSLVVPWMIWKPHASSLLCALYFRWLKALVMDPCKNHLLRPGLPGDISLTNKSFVFGYIPTLIIGSRNRPACSMLRLLLLVKLVHLPLFLQWEDILCIQQSTQSSVFTVFVISLPTPFSPSVLYFLLAFCLKSGKCKYNRYNKW